MLIICIKVVQTNGSCGRMVMKKILFTAVTIAMLLMSIVFGSGMGCAGGGTFNPTDSNRFVVFTSKAQLDGYVESHQGDFFNVPESERSQYDGKFFETNALVMFLTDGMSGSIKVVYEGYQLKGDELHVTVKEISPPIHTMDLKYNVLCAAVPKKFAQGINKVVIDSYRVEI